ncbi:hypothetical protein TEA_028188 [Camellia sinensis var. sinensis]|uniref:non-specific serine/threonine protein kinase n=1 Tax=Camellia sinensis var. sinensis TaxID=542762 RepID=A0A4S4DEZ4_CAMSN|nr:hypothetical protein TEA_028188 [Camellia sinensis var. sinensis]
MVNPRDTPQEIVWAGHVTHPESSELPMLDLNKILVATNNFSQPNKLGEGGFGPVYKGKLEDGQQIAVKRLSSHSGQGNEEFKNEIILISKLRHRNLVRLLGCCIEGEEKILVYEYLTNRSLDTILFGETEAFWELAALLVLKYVQTEAFSGKAVVLRVEKPSVHPSLPEAI